MTSQQTAFRISGLIFALICLGHVWRIIAHVDVRLGQYQIGMWLSVVALIIAGALSIWLLTLSKK